MTEEEAQKHERPAYKVKVTDAPKFDLGAYVANYRGRTVFRRLYLIASCSTTLSEEAARMAVSVARRGSDVQNYHDALSLLQKITGSKEGKEAADTVWVAQQEKRNAAETKRLESELKQYKNNLIRESIRMGNEDLGSHYHSIGELSSAIKAFSRMREYCTTPVHFASNAFRIISVAIEQRNWLAVQSQVTKLLSQSLKPEESARSQPKVMAAKGLHALSLHDYREAATSFLTIDPSLGDSYNEVLSSNDVAIYGGLCALASMSRSDLQSKVLESNTFRSFLELEPHIRRAINAFCASKYSACLEILEAYRADYLLDIYLQDEVPFLYQRIRTKAIVQYFQPFSRVTLDSMEKMFGQPTLPADDTPTTNTSLTPFQRELADLIATDRLSARLDLEHNILIAHEEPARLALQQKALETTDAFIREARIKLLRLNAVNGELVVKPEQRKGKGPGMVEGLIDGDREEGGYGGGTSGGGAFGGIGHSLRGSRT